jgi:hypothetical protein
MYYLDRVQERSLLVKDSAVVDVLFCIQLNGVQRIRPSSISSLLLTPGSLERDQPMLTMLKESMNSYPVVFSDHFKAAAGYLHLAFTCCLTKTSFLHTQRLQNSFSILRLLPTRPGTPQDTMGQQSHLPYSLATRIATMLLDESPGSSQNILAMGLIHRSWSPALDLLYKMPISATFNFHYRRPSIFKYAMALQMRSDRALLIQEFKLADFKECHRSLAKAKGEKQDQFMEAALSILRLAGNLTNITIDHSAFFDRKDFAAEIQQFGLRNIVQLDIKPMRLGRPGEIVDQELFAAEKDYVPLLDVIPRFLAFLPSLSSLGITGLTWVYLGTQKETKKYVKSSSVSINMTGLLTKSPVRKLCRTFLL